MIQIRRGTFETNSSSAHSIVVRKPMSTLGFEKNNRRTEHFECGYIDQNGKMHVYENEFGRGFSVLSAWQDKFIYALVELNSNREAMDRLVEVMKRRHPEFKEINIDVDPNEPFGWGSWGHIDHQSQGNLTLALEKENISAEDFIDDDKYVIVIDSDEICYLDMLSRAGLLNKAAIAKQYPYDDDPVDSWEDE